MTIRYPRAALAAVCGAASAILSCAGPVAELPRTEPLPPVRVCIADRVRSATVALDADADLVGPNGSVPLRAPYRFTCRVSPGGTITFSGSNGTVLDYTTPFRCVPSSSEGRFRIGGRTYAGSLLLASDGTDLYVVDVLPLERYLEGVVPSEIGRSRTSAEIEAIKAQTVLARTYAIAKMDLPTRRLFDVYDDARDQVFEGDAPCPELHRRAVDATRGLVLAYHGDLAECYFHSTCGGSTEAVSLVWDRPQSKPYLAGIRDGDGDRTYCRISPSFRWTETYTRRDMEALLATYLPSTEGWNVPRQETPSLRLVDMRILRRHPSGRVAELQILLDIHGERKSVVLRSEKIRWVIRRSDATSPLRSTLFDVDLERDGAGNILTVRLHGGGSGHGVGMCQWGAIERAREGAGFADILKAYFPGTNVAAVR